jgi:hypothetical protein
LYKKFASTKRLLALKIFLYRKIICIEIYLHRKIVFIEKTASHTKMLHLKLLWALDVKLMYEKFPFPLGIFFENDCIIKAI